MCSYVKSWGGPSTFWGSGPPPTPQWLRPWQLLSQNTNACMFREALHRVAVRNVQLFSEPKKNLIVQSRGPLHFHVGSRGPLDLQLGLLPQCPIAGDANHYICLVVLPCCIYVWYVLVCGERQSFFCIELSSAIHDRRASKFDLRYRNHSDLFCQMISSL